MLVSSFAGLILIGTLLLMLPFSTPRPISIIDAVFTSTSAVCVTGLSVLDLGKDLSFVGQLVTLFLFQIGGLGIMTFSTVLLVLMGRGISFKGREILQTTFLHTPRRDVFVVLKAIILYTVIFELFGAILLFVAFSRDFAFGEALYHSVYHSVSAFVNCGFSLFPDSLIRYQGSVLVNFTLLILFVVGGIGFVVQHELMERLRGRRKRWSVHSRLVIVTTLVLLVFGTLFFFMTEFHNVLNGMPLGKQLLVSFFQAATPRTCGLSTVDFRLLTNETILMILILMFIGASPGSVGGGIKTTSAALLFLLMWNRILGNEGVNVFNRTIPREIVSRTMSIVFAAAFSIFLVASFLLLFEGRGADPVQTRHLFVEYLFETISAFGTVGLSIGATAKLNTAQKIAIILLMFAGRVGPLTLAYAWLRSRRGRPGPVYAEEPIAVG
jgi:trk system potassium uptake protein TrkH